MLDLLSLSTNNPQNSQINNTFSHLQYSIVLCASGVIQFLRCSLVPQVFSSVLWTLWKFVDLRSGIFLENDSNFNCERQQLIINLMFSTISQRSQNLLHLQRYYAAKQLLFGSQARKQLLEGSKQLSNAVQVTLGPGGRNVLIDQSYGSPKITKDGVTVAKAVELTDKAINIGATLVKNVANKANDEAGDGTTTATILARAIYQEGFKKVEAGLNPTHIKRGIDLAIQHVSNQLHAQSTEVRGSAAISNVATISANGDRKIGEMLANLYEKVGIHGTITVQEGKTLHHEIQFVDGLKFDRGYISPYFVTDEKKQKIEFENCYVLIVEKKLGNIREVLPFLQLTFKEQKPLLIIAEDIESELLAGLILNRLKNNLKICAVKAPSFGDNRKAQLQDIAIFTGGKFVSEEAGVTLENSSATPEEIKATLGLAKNITITKDDTILLHGNGSKAQIESRAEIIKEQIKSTESSYDKEKLEERLAKLQGGIGVIKVGGASEVEVGQIKDRVTDALCATKAALAEGIVPGGGSALLYASKSLDSLINNPKLSQGQIAGIRIVQNAIKIPAITIAQNAGYQGSLIAAKLLEQGNPERGFNAANGTYVNLKQSGIVDPTKVVRTALIHSGSVASLMLTTECMIFEEPEKKDK